MNNESDWERALNERFARSNASFCEAADEGFTADLIRKIGVRQSLRVKRARTFLMALCFLSALMTAMLAKNAFAAAAIPMSRLQADLLELAASSDGYLATADRPAALFGAMVICWLIYVTLDARLGQHRA